MINSWTIVKLPVKPRHIVNSAREGGYPDTLRRFRGIVPLGRHGQSDEKAIAQAVRKRQRLFRYNRYRWRIPTREDEIAAVKRKL